MASFRTLLELNGFSAVATPSGSESVLYLAEGVVATPPLFDRARIPFASGYQEFAREIDLEDVGVFGDVRHLLSAPASKTDRLFAQPVGDARSHLHPDDGVDGAKRRTLLPVLVQEDLTLYRLAETSAARFLDGTYARISGWTQKRVVRPLTNARYRTRVAIKSANALRARLRSVLERSLADRALEGIRNLHAADAVPAAAIADSPPPSSDRGGSPPSSSSKPAKDHRGGDGGGGDREAPVVVGGRTEKEEQHADPDAANRSIAATGIPATATDRDHEDDPLETVVAITSRPRTARARGVGRHRDDDDEDEIVDSVALFRRMTPATRMLTLPGIYVLRHSSASTLVSVSLVVFGALPLAYRSYLFSVNYGWLPGAGSIAAASVLATVGYYIVVGRWRARTSQRGALHEALAARVGARDEAALLLLREGAVRAVSRAVSEAVDGRGGSASAAARPQPPPTSVDPVSWAIDLGLLPPPPPDLDDESEGTERPEEKRAP